MTLEECIDKKEILSEHLELNIKYNGTDLVFKLGDIVRRLTIVKLIRYRENNGATRSGKTISQALGYDD